MLRLSRWIRGIPVFSCMPLFFCRLCCRVWIGLFLCFLIACHTDTKYHVYQSVPGKNGWLKQDSLTFNLPSSISAGEYRMEIGVRNTGGYPYRDIWLSVTRMEGLLPAQTDTVHIYLADENGHWGHENAIGGLYQQTFICEKPIVLLNDSVECCFRITHLMRKNPLPGVSDVGIRLFFAGRIDTEKNK